MPELEEAIREDGKTGSPNYSEKTKNFIIDIDGVVCEDIPNEEPERMPDAEEMPSSKEQINRWYDEGHVITFFTARTEEHRAVTEAWLKERGFRYHNLILGKPRGGNYHYIDDRVVRATKFEGKLGRFVEKEMKIQVFE